MGETSRGDCDRCVGSDDKARLAAAHGCDHTIVYTREDIPARVKEITGGAMLPVAYDSVGQATFMKSIDCLRPRGLMVAFGQASGIVPPFSVNILSAKGSLYLTRPTLQTYTAKREELVERANALFDVLANGTVKCEVQRRFPLRDAAEAHRALGERNTTGSRCPDSRCRDSMIARSRRAQMKILVFNCGSSSLKFELLEIGSSGELLRANRAAASSRRSALTLTPK